MFSAWQPDETGTPFESQVTAAVVAAHSRKSIACASQPGYGENVLMQPAQQLAAVGPAEQPAATVLSHECWHASSSDSPWLPPEPP
jgi:hypothetical protein